MRKKNNEKICNGIKCIIIITKVKRKKERKKTENIKRLRTLLFSANKINVTCKTSLSNPTEKTSADQK